MRKTRICFVLTNFFFENKGGAELQAYYLADVLSRRNHNVSYIREKTNRYLSGLFNDKINLQSIYSNRYIRRSFALRNLIRKWSLNRLFKELQPDIVYTRSDDSYLHLLIQLRGKFNYRLIWACAHDDKTSRQHWQKKYGKSLGNKLLQSLQKADFRLFQTNNQLQAAKLNLGLEGILIRNSHPVPEFPDSFREDMVLWIGRIVRRKRPELFLELVRAARNSNTQFVMIGDTHDKHYHEIIQKAERDFPNFTYTGEHENDEVIQYLTRTKLLVNTSESEGFSNTFIEAWLRAVPVLTFGLDPDALITEHQLGFVAEDIQSADKWTDSLLENDVMFRQLSENCYRFAADNFKIESAADQLEQLIEQG